MPATLELQEQARALQIHQYQQQEAYLKLQEERESREREEREREREDAREREERERERRKDRERRDRERREKEENSPDRPKSSGNANQRKRSPEKPVIKTEDASKHCQRGGLDHHIEKVKESKAVKERKSSPGIGVVTPNKSKAECGDSVVDISKTRLQPAAAVSDVVQEQSSRDNLEQKQSNKQVPSEPQQQRSESGGVAVSKVSKEPETRDNNGEIDDQLITVPSSSASLKPVSKEKAASEKDSESILVEKVKTEPQQLPLPDGEQVSSHNQARSSGDETKKLDVPYSSVKVQSTKSDSSPEKCSEVQKEGADVSHPTLTKAPKHNDSKVLLSSGSDGPPSSSQQAGKSHAPQPARSVTLGMSCLKKQLNESIPCEMLVSGNNNNLMRSQRSETSGSGHKTSKHDPPRPVLTSALQSTRRLLHSPEANSKTSQPPTTTVATTHTRRLSSSTTTTTVSAAKLTPVTVVTSSGPDGSVYAMYPSTKPMSMVYLPPGMSFPNVG